MCGINGVYNYSRMSLPDSETLIRRMNQAISHRGPDDSGIWLDNNNQVHFGHQRLSIFDLSSKGHQPMKSSGGNVIVLNGEIFNYQTLKKDLQNYSFISETDTEVVLYLYEKNAQNCLNELNGMFAFVIWDNEKRELFLARDRLGIKPLYFTTINGIFAFSSEIKALLTLPWIKADLDEEALYHFLTFNKVSAPYTVFKGIQKFHPGYKMTVNENGIESYIPYWQPSYSDYSSLSVSELAEMVFNQLDRSVKEWMISDVNVGAFLSGGVDSSAVVALMRTHTSSPVKTYSVGFQDAPLYDEREYALKISKQFGTEHHEKIITPKDIVDFLPRVVDIYDEPLADATSIPIYFISQSARADGTTVILTGDGSDELFCGYRSWLRYAKLYPLYHAYGNLPQSLKSAIADLYGIINRSSPNYDILKRAAKGQEFFWGGAGGFKESTKRSFLSVEYATKMSTLDSYEQVLYYRTLFENVSRNSREMTDIDWMCYMGLKDIVPNYYLYRADHLGMAHSIEIRVPFLDHNFVNLALSVPGKWKIANNEPKYILKKALENILPNDILYRKKQGFCVPLREWTGDITIDYIERNLKSFCRDTGLFDENSLRNQISAHKSGNIEYSFTLWNIYFLISWFKRWML